MEQTASPVTNSGGSIASRFAWQHSLVSPWVRLLPALLLLLTVAVGCRKEETPAPQNVLQYQLGGWMRGTLNGRSIDRVLAGDTFRLEAFLNRSQAVVFRDTMSVYTVRDTGTGPFVERSLKRFWRFNLYRFHPQTASALNMTFPLWNVADDTAAHFLGINFQQDIRQALSDSAFLQLEARVSNLPLPAVTQDPEARIFGIRWDSAAGQLSGQFRYRLLQRRNPVGPVTDTATVTGDFSLPITRAVR